LHSAAVDRLSARPCNLSNARSGALYAYPREKSIRRLQDQVRQRTKRRMPMPTELIETVNPCNLCNLQAFRNIDG
jgi:hypothetical protein